LAVRSSQSKNLRLFEAKGAQRIGPIDVRVNGHQVAGVIFDIDGTLVDSFGTLVSVFNIILKKYHLAPVSEEFLASCSGQI